MLKITYKKRMIELTHTCVNMLTLKFAIWRVWNHLNLIEGEG